MIKKFFTILGAAFLFPVQILAQQIDSTNVTLLITSSHTLVNRLIPVLISLSVIYVIYSVVLFIGETDDSQKKEEKKQQIFWGIIGLFVIVAVWGLVALVGRTFNIFAGGALTV